MDLAEEGCFDGEVGFEREVSNLKLKLVRKITFGTLGADPEIVHAGAFVLFMRGIPTRMPRM